jgi:hypothetical protein
VQPSLSEVGLDPTRFGSAKQFASWLGLCRGNNRSGGKRHGSKTRKVVNRAANAAGIAAMAAGQSDSAIGGVFRQLKARLGAPKAMGEVGEMGSGGDGEWRRWGRWGGLGNSSTHPPIHPLPTTDYHYPSSLIPHPSIDGCEKSQNRSSSSPKEVCLVGTWLVS